MLLSAKPTHGDKRSALPVSCSKGPKYHKNLNWCVKHQTVITCGEPGEICKHPECGVTLRLLLCNLPPYTTPKQNHMLISKLKVNLGFILYPFTLEKINWVHLGALICSWGSTVSVWTLNTMDIRLNMYTCVIVAVCSFFPKPIQDLHTPV